MTKQDHREKDQRLEDSGEIAKEQAPLEQGWNLAGFGRGLGCGRGMGRGFGCRNGFGYGRQAGPTKEEEKKILKAELKDLESEKQEIERMLKEMK
jgi:hypothetical protein